MKFKEYLNEALVGASGNHMDSDIAKFTLDSLIFVSQTHVYHLVTKSYAEHMAIGEFYAGLQVLIDGLAEQTIGLNIELNDAVTSANLDFGYSKDRLIAELNTYRDSISILLEKTNVPALMSINDTLINIQTSIDTLLYKLQLG